MTIAAASSSPIPGPGFGARFAFALRVLRADLGNFFLLQYPAIDAFLITGKNSGTHWLKFMLSCAIAHHFDVPPPAYASGRGGDAIIGHPRWPPVYPHLPRIGSSHSIPSIAFAWPFRLFAHAPVVVLVRDIREALLSNYVKWRQHYAVSLTEYISGDPAGRKFVADIWWYVHFFNRWGDLAQARPAAILIVRYEDIIAAPDAWLRRIAAHLSVTLSDASVAAGLAFADRGAVRELLDPGYGETIIPDASERDRVGFSPAQRDLLDGILHRHLRHSLGYDYGLPQRRPPVATAPHRAQQHAP